MIKWKNPSEDDLSRLEAIKILCGSHPWMIDFLFHPSKPRLSNTPERLKEKMSCFSQGEKTLILVAMDI